MKMVRTELFHYHMVYDVLLDGVHHYVYGLPYYDELYVGRHIYPDGVKFYEISPEVYVNLLVMKEKDKTVCQEYMESQVDSQLVYGKELEGYRYIGDKKDFYGSCPSAVMQILLQHI